MRPYSFEPARSSAQCKCSSVQVLVSDEPVVQLVCHCHDCQQFTGLDFVEAAFFCKEHCSVNGETLTESVQGGSGEEKINHYCASCKEPVYAEITVLNGAVAVLARRLSNFDFEPRSQVWLSHRAEGIELPIDSPYTLERPDDETIKLMLKGFYR